MKVLFWVPPWPVNGDYEFFNNTVEKHLIKQANTLVKSNNDVSIDFIITYQTDHLKDKLSDEIKIIYLPFEFALDNEFVHYDVYSEFYSQNLGLINYTSECLKPFLASHYDVIMLWETPVPFLEVIYPQALIVHQMPGFFSRPPYPHTVIFDTEGLYKQGFIANHALEIQNMELTKSEQKLVYNFRKKAKSAISSLQPYNNTVGRVRRYHSEEGSQLSLLPLQTSSHYAFKVDTGFKDQLHFMNEVLKSNKNDSYILTQYTSRLISDAPINENNFDVISDKYDNLFYDQTFSYIDTPSQYLVELVDKVVTASSSIGFQSMIWEKELEVIGNTYLKSFDSRNVPQDLKWSSICEKTLGFALCYHQPLYTSVTEDSVFLYNLLVNLIHRKDKHSLDKLVSFNECSKKYNQNLLSSFRYNAADKVVSANFKETRKDKILNEFRALVNDKEVEAISFDVFDTLIDRPFEKPVDLFKFMESEVKYITGGLITDFSKIRPFCEVETRKVLRNQDEISLDDIYITLQQYYGISNELVEKIKFFEVFSEIDCVSSRGMGKVLYNIASDSNKPIYLISDMYLPKNVVQKMLSKCGYDTYDELYVSSEYLVRKHNGLLFDLFLKDKKLEPKELLHIGDNKKTDINVPRSKGIKTFRWSSAIEWLRTNPKLKDIYHPRKGAGEKPRSALAGLTARGMFDQPVDLEFMKSVTQGNPYSLGYTVLGPLVLGYVSWIARKAKDSSANKIFFLAREGDILKRAYDSLFGEVKGYPKSEYLYASRRVVRVANIKTDSDIASLISAPYDPGVPLVQLLESRFGIELDDFVEKLLYEKGISVEKILSRSLDDKLIFSNVCKELSSLIFGNSSLERENYLAYLDKVGFLDENRPFIVDVGWKANIQGDLGLLTNKGITGCYYATLQGAENWLKDGSGHEHLGYFGTNVSPQASSSALVANRHLIEFLLCAPHKSIISVYEKDGIFYPKYQNEEGYDQRYEFTTNVHLGTLDFVQSYHNHYKNYSDQIYFDSEMAEKAFSFFCNSPSAIDANLLVGLSFEDALGGIKQKFIISPDSDCRAQSVWKEGFDAYHSSNKSKKQNEVTPDSSDTENDSKLIGYEKKVLEKLVSKQKFNKLMRDRNSFFLDSTNRVSKLYLKVTKKLSNL